MSPVTGEAFSQSIKFVMSFHGCAEGASSSNYYTFIESPCQGGRLHLLPTAHVLNCKVWKMFSVQSQRGRYCHFPNPHSISFLDTWHPGTLTMSNHWGSPLYFTLLFYYYSQLMTKNRMMEITIELVIWSLMKHGWCNNCSIFKFSLVFSRTHVKKSRGLGNHFTSEFRMALLLVSSFF